MEKLTDIENHIYHVLKSRNGVRLTIQEITKTVIDAPLSAEESYRQAANRMAGKGIIKREQDSPKKIYYSLPTHRQCTLEYRHYKGGLYRLLHYAFMEIDKSEVACYQDVETGAIYVRPLNEFEEKFSPQWSL